MSKSLERWCVAWVLALVACARDDAGGDRERASCALRGIEMPVGPGAETELGSVSTIASRIDGSDAVPLELWREDGSSETLQATIIVRANSDRAWLVPYRDAENANESCPPALEVDAVVELRTADELLNESIPGRVSLRADRLTFAGKLPVQQKRGTFDPDTSPQAVYMMSMSRALEGAEDELSWSGQLVISEPESSVVRTVADW